LDIFRDIYKEKRKIKEQAKGDLQKIKTLRIKQIQPLLTQIKDWIIEEQYNVLPKSKIGSAMTYFTNQYHKFENILKNGKIELDNNKIENSIRPMAIGRKNYIFCGSHKAAQNAALLYSFFGSCKMKNTNPREWLEDTL
jgi:hypothetical protein